MKLRGFNKDIRLNQLRKKQQREYNVKNRTLILSVGILILSIVFLTYARLESNSNDFVIVNATVGDFSKDVRIISYRYDDGSGTVQNHNTPPAKNSGYSASNISCQNASATWNSEEWGLDIRNITGKVNCTLEFKEAYIVSYNANGGSGEPSAQTKIKGTTLQLSSTVPSKTGYAFAGWATTSNGVVAYQNDSNYTTDANVTLYARWYKTEYTAEEVVSIGNENFLVLGNSSSSSSTVRLLAQYPLNVDPSSNNYNKQVVKTEATSVGWNPKVVNGTMEVSYENSDIKGYIDSYVLAVKSRDYRDLTIRDSGLMTSDDVKFIEQNSKTYGGYFSNAGASFNEGWGTMAPNAPYWLMPGICPILHENNNDNKIYWLFIDPYPYILVDRLGEEYINMDNYLMAPVLEIDKKDLY